MEGGLSHWDKRHLTNYLIKPEIITPIIEDRNGIVWFTRSRLSDAAEGGLCQVIGTGMRCYGKADGMSGSDGADTLVEDTLESFSDRTCPSRITFEAWASGPAFRAGSSL